MNDFVITATTEQSIFFYLSFFFLGMLLCSLFVKPKVKVVYEYKIVKGSDAKKVELDNSDLSLVAWGKRKHG